MKPKIGSTINPEIIRPNDVKTLLGEGELGCMLDWRVWNPKTNEILEEHTQKSESFVQQFLQLLMVEFIKPFIGVGNLLPHGFCIPAYRLASHRSGFSATLSSGLHQCRCGIQKKITGTWLFRLPFRKNANHL